MEYSKATLEVDCDLEHISQVENFILSLDKFTNMEKNKLMIVCTEVFENIIHHTRKLKSNVVLRIRKNKSISVLFYYKSMRFDVFVSRIKDSKLYYDSKEKRYRGMGIRMCYNISQSIHYRITPKFNVIAITI